jgi:hypothetical protein
LRLAAVDGVLLFGVNMLKNPKQQEALFARRERQKVEGAQAMKEYLTAESETRRKTKRLRELRLAKESAAREATEQDNRG